MSLNSTFAFSPPRPDGRAADGADSGPDSEYEAVEGRDAATTALKRQYEAEVEAKVASDHQHIIAAYAVIWVIFLVYGMFLWRRNVGLQRDLEALRQQVDKA